MAKRRRKVIPASSRFRKGFRSDEQRKAVMAMVMRGKQTGKVVGKGRFSSTKSQKKRAASRSTFGTSALLGGRLLNPELGTAGHAKLMRTVESLLENVRALKSSPDVPRAQANAYSWSIAQLTEIRSKLKAGKPVQWDKKWRRGRGE